LDSEICETTGGKLPILDVQPQPNQDVRNRNPDQILGVFPRVIGMGKSTSLVVANLALCLTSCAIPNRTGYSIAAEHHEKFAQIASEGVTADEAAARSFTAQGNQSAASHAEESASQFRRTYWVERFQADKDRWLSQWLPSL
jgi:hypothetical protein